MTTEQHRPIELDQKDVAVLDLASLWSQTKRMLDSVLAENTALKQRIVELTMPETEAAN